MKDEPEEAELILHEALRLAIQSNKKKAIIYTYDLVTNLSHWWRVDAREGMLALLIYIPDLQDYKALGFCLTKFYFFP